MSLTNHPDLHKFILERGPFSQEENERIFRKFFSRPTRAFLYCNSKYRLSEKRVLEIGCTYGNTLMRFGEGSVGIDALPKSVTFAQHLGLHAISQNIEDPLPSDLRHEQFDAIWCAHVIEHLVSPHLLLRTCHTLLRPDGLLLIGYPVIPPPFIRRYGMFRGYLAEEHVNFFHAVDMEHMLRRSGFHVIETNSCFPVEPKWLNDALRPLMNWIAPSLTTVAQKDDAFQYSKKRDPHFTPGWVKNG